MGKTVIYYPDADPTRLAHAAALQDLVAKMNAGDVKTLAILGGNPVYDAPADLAFGEALEKAVTAISFTWRRILMKPPYRMHVASFAGSCAGGPLWMAMCGRLTAPRV